ncbi:ORF-31 [Catopsilia pomona nucleopolyhedrovirus]|uniref:ORF-31 n=1 Tax=Catopsilia pomona nucleopolyhedrovirus TaxID=1850906 RepID=A0A172WZA3_9ABAC|nr:ORF-31 [Catopsilia pomona nucleopolyhedrovirus]ANF29679.1 ORF-31 [Catopsilia pomona nucleopolyhedrovirus]
MNNSSMLPVMLSYISTDKIPQINLLLFNSFYVFLIVFLIELMCKHIVWQFYVGTVAYNVLCFIAATRRYMCAAAIKHKNNTIIHA